jgi:hypothetical protein
MSYIGGKEQSTEFSTLGELRSSSALPEDPRSFKPCPVFMNLWEGEGWWISCNPWTLYSELLAHMEESTHSHSGCWVLWQPWECFCFCSIPQNIRHALTREFGATDYHSLCCLSSQLLKILSGGTTDPVHLLKVLFCLSNNQPLWQSVPRLPEAVVFLSFHFPRACCKPCLIVYVCVSKAAPWVIASHMQKTCLSAFSVNLRHWDLV